MPSSSGVPVTYNSPCYTPQTWPAKYLPSQQGRWSPTRGLPAQTGQGLFLDTQKWRDWSQKLGSPHIAHPREPVPHSHGPAGHMIVYGSQQQVPTEGQVSPAVWPSAGRWVACWWHGLALRSGTSFPMQCAGHTLTGAHAHASEVL